MITWNRITPKVELYNSALLEGEEQMTFDEMCEIEDIDEIEVDEYLRLS